MSKPQPNVALKTAIFASGREQRRIAKLARIAPEKLSHVVRGRRELDDDERARLCRVLGKPEAELFPPEALAS